MRFFVAIILTGLLSFSWALFFPWWVIAIAAFIVAAVIPQPRFRAFISGFLALFLLWGGQAMLVDLKNAHILSAKVAGILPLGGSSVILLLVTAIIGGLVAGFAALSGSYLRTPPVIRKKKFYKTEPAKVPVDH